MPDFAKHSVREIFHELKKFFVTFSSRSSHAKQNKKNRCIAAAVFQTYETNNNPKIS